MARHDSTSRGYGICVAKLQSVRNLRLYDFNNSAHRFNDSACGNFWRKRIGKKWCDG